MKTEAIILAAMAMLIGRNVVASTNQIPESSVQTGIVRVVAVRGVPSVDAYYLVTFQTEGGQRVVTALRGYHHPFIGECARQLGAAWTNATPDYSHLTPFRITYRTTDVPAGKTLVLESWKAEGNPQNKTPEDTARKLADPQR